MGIADRDVPGGEVCVVGGVALVAGGVGMVGMVMNGWNDKGGGGEREKCCTRSCSFKRKGKSRIK